MLLKDLSTSCLPVPGSHKAAAVFSRALVPTMIQIMEGRGMVVGWRIQAEISVLSHGRAGTLRCVLQRYNMD